MASTIYDVGPWGAGVESSLSVRLAEPLEVVLHGAPVQFATRHAECAVYLLALKGDEGMMAFDLGMSIWPGAPPHKRGPRIRTLLWQVRIALGEDSWRVQRRGPVVVLDMIDADLVVGIDLDPGVGLGRDGSDRLHPDQVLASRLLRALARRGRPRTSRGRSRASSFL